MDRTVPSRGSDELSLYLRTYYSLLRSTREVQIKSLIEAHKRIDSALHVAADKDTPDLAAYIYVVLRLPAEIASTRLVVMGQSDRVFAAHGYPDVEEWQPVTAPGRRRYYYYDGSDTLAVFIASRSDIDDMIPTLTAYEIERRKLYEILNDDLTIELLKSKVAEFPGDDLLSQLSLNCGISFEDLDRLRRIWQQAFAGNLLTIAKKDQSLSVRLLAGSLVEYKRATHQWWHHVSTKVPGVSFEDHPVYFVSSNTHSMANMLSGFALYQEETLRDYVEHSGAAELLEEYQDILERNVPSSKENFLYYALKKYENANPAAIDSRLSREREAGLIRIPSRHVFDIEAQIVRLQDLRMEYLDHRLCVPDLEKLSESNALIVNIDFPLGMAAYQVLTEISRNCAEIRGIYVMGKAATLNGTIGDVMIPNVVHDEQSRNTYLFNNRFKADDVAPHLVYGTVMDNQKSISALGTFLQNEVYMDVFYQEGYTIIEMEAGPFLSAIYEMVRPQRYPVNELVNLYSAPFPIGILHYASDTPFSKGKNLGSQNLSYFGMDPTYATMIAILREILSHEIRTLRQKE